MTPPNPRQIVLLGSGLTGNGAGGARVNPLLAEVLALTGRPDPRVCVLNTALGDDARAYTQIYGAFAAAGARTTHLALFPMPSVPDPASHLLAQDVVFVGGGSVANMVAVWRVHDLDHALRAAWEAGVILCGVSAGAICWFEGGTTDSFGFDLAPFTDGLAFLPGSYTPHYDSEARRRPAFQGLVAAGTIPPGWASDDGAAMRFAGTELADVYGDRDGAAVYRVEAGGEQRVEPRRLS